MNNEFEMRENNQSELSAKSFAKKNSILGSSLLWFGYCLLVAFTVAILTLTNIEPIYLWMGNHIGVQIAIPIVGFILLCVAFFLGWRMNFWVLLPIVTVIMSIFGFSLLSVVFYGLAHNFDWLKTFAILLIPAGMIFIFGVLATYNLINIKKIWIATLFVFGTMLVVGIISWFVLKEWIYVLYLSLGLVLVTLYIAIDMFMIVKFNKYYKESSEAETLSKWEINKIGLFFGFKLAYDYVYAVLYLYQLFGRNK